MAAVVCAVAALTGTTAPASAADGPFPEPVGGAPVSTDVTAAAEAAAAIADTELASDLAATATDVAAAVAGDGQYQPSDGQYQAETGQYQPPAAPEPAAPVTAPANINVSVRVLSPGDDGAVSQSISGIEPASSAAAPAVAAAATVTQVSISISVNVTNNWHVILPTPHSDGWYQSPDTQYQTPSAIDPTNQPPAAPSSTSGDAPTAASAPPLPAVEPPVAAVQPARPRAAAAATAKRERGTPGRGRGRAAAPAPVMVAAVSAAVTAPAPAPTAVRAVAAPSRPNREPARANPPQRPAFPLPNTPEQLGNGGAAGAFGFGNVLQSLAILVASLLLAWLAPARRLAASVPRPGDAPHKRRRKPG